MFCPGNYPVGFSDRDVDNLSLSTATTAYPVGFSDKRCGIFLPKQEIPWDFPTKQLIEQLLPLAWSENPTVDMQLDGFKGQTWLLSSRKKCNEQHTL